MATSFFRGSFFSGEFFSPSTSGGGRARRRRQRYLVRYNGQEYYADSIAEVEALASDFREQAAEELKNLPPRAKRRKAKRPAIRIEAGEELQQELYKYDLPNVAPILAAFDFERMRAIMDRLDAIRSQQDMDDESDVEILLLL